MRDNVAPQSDIKCSTQRHDDVDYRWLLLDTAGEKGRRLLTVSEIFLMEFVVFVVLSSINI